MAFGWNRTRYSPIAVDFGDNGLKLLQIVPGDPPRLLAAGVATIPADIADRWGFYSDSVRRLVKEFPFKGRRAVCTTPAHQTLIQHLQIAGADLADLDRAVGEELRSRLNIDPSRMVVRHFTVGQFVRNGTPRQEVICAAASRDTVLRHVGILKQVGLETAGIYSEPQTIVQAFAHLYRRRDDHERTTCFMDLGASTVKVVISHGTKMVFAKTIHNVALASESRDEVDSPTAPAEPRAPGAPHGPVIDVESTLEDGLDTSDTVSSDRRGPVGTDRSVTARRSGLAVLDAPAASAETTNDSSEQDSALDCLVDELQLCLRYHQGMFPERCVEKVVFLGGGAKQTGRCQQIAKALRITAQLGDPLARLVRSDGGATASGLDMRQPQPGWAVPMGLCLSQS